MIATSGSSDEVAVPETVVVPLDGSTSSELALPLAHALAAAFGATVRTVTVGGDDVGGDGPDVALDGDPAEALLAHLAGHDRAVVCMASHGHGGIHRRLLGSVAEQLIRRASVPVIVTGPRVARVAIAATPRTLLAGVTFSPRQHRLLQLLTVWAPVLDAKVELAHVRMPTAAELYVTRTMGRLPPDRPDLDELTADLRGQGVPATSHVLAGTDPVTELPRLADRLRPPVLLAVDSHHADEAVRHDVAYQLIRSSRWPVLAGLGT
jgi:nucleotide-binding universal stress UspA family protein